MQNFRLSLHLKKRIESCFYKIVRLLCRDFRNQISRKELIKRSGLLSLRSMFVVRDMKLLHKFCTTLFPDPITERLMSQCHVLAGWEFFCDYIIRRIGRFSFINRAKYISVLIPFE